jgi:hypothetical protein
MDNVVFDMSQSSEQAPSIFLRKDWISIMDNNNTSYASNNLTLDTSALSNSNKYISWREGILSVPLLLSITSSGTFNPATAATGADYGFGLKNNYASVIHSISVDLQGSTIIQQTAFINLFNNFRLLTTMSWQDVSTIGSSIGFFPDTSGSWEASSAVSLVGVGCCNNNNYQLQPVVSAALNPQESFNRGLYERQKAFNFNPSGITGVAGTQLFSAFVSVTNLKNIYKSYIQTQANGAAGTNGLQFVIMANIMLRHLHPFFDKMVLSKGVFMKITLLLNNATTQFTTVLATSLGVPTVNVPSGGINPIMVASMNTLNGNAAIVAATYSVSLSVGSNVLGGVNGAGVVTGVLSRSVMLNVPSVVFNPIYESAYLSSPVKNIEYSDVYSYQVLNILSGGTLNNLITNGIANIKSVLVIPFFNSTYNATLALSPLLSPYDDCGGGTTSPLCHLYNFNVQISGQNAIYNNQRYTYEAFLQQLNGQNAVNGNQVDGLGSSLINQLDFENKYCYYFVNVERQLPIERSVPKSVVLQGVNASAHPVDYYVFLEYGQSLALNVLLGSRV